MKNQYKIYISFLFLFINLNGISQFQHSATIEKVDSSGYYKLNLDSQIIGLTQRNFSDLRLFDENNNEIPYILSTLETNNVYKSVTHYNFQQELQDKKTNIYILTDETPISSFNIIIKNADVVKVATLKGSNDTKKWFVVKDNISLRFSNSANSTTSSICIQFPLSDYKNYLLEINDSLSAPLNVLDITKTETSVENGKSFFTLKPKIEYIQNDGKTTDFNLILPYKYKISHLIFHVSSPRLFNRPTEIVYYKNSSKVDLTSENKTIYLDVFTDTLQFKIFNGDDKALTIDSISAYSPSYFIVAEFEKDKIYHLSFGDEKIKLPQYDLSFKSEIPRSLPLIRTSNIEISENYLKNNPKTWVDFILKYGIWMIILVVILQIIRMVMKLSK